MKNTNMGKMFALVLAVTAAALWPAPASASPQSAWPPLPKLILQRCIAARQSVNRNPFSAASNDFFVITTYKENGNESAIPGSEKKPAPGNRSPALSVYLVVRIFLVKSRPAPIVHDAALMITEKNMVSRDTKNPVARRWILMDVDGDGTVDKLLFSQSLKKKEAPTHEVKIPAGRKRELQAYYKNAVRSLTKKAANPTADMCLPI
jgi:hypothetical protein